ncbi:nuclear transport factor 2 family protein [Bordetella sp. 2513F-2]
MPVSLPHPISAYFEAGSRKDAARVAECFAPDATVRDEGRAHRGHDAILAWQAGVQKAFEFHVEPLGVSRRDGHVVVTTRVAGNFPGSPVELEHVFLLAGDRIQSLEIR